MRLPTVATIWGFFIARWWPAACWAGGIAKRLLVLLMPLAFIGPVGYGGGMAAYYTSTAVQQYQADRSLRYPPTFAQAVNFARRMDALADKFPQEPLVTDQDGQFTVAMRSFWGYFESNDAALTQLAIEIVPYFEYEDIVSQARYPKVVLWAPMAGFAHNHVLGQANCRPTWGQPTAVIMNYRYVSPFSYWNDERFPYSAIVHELAHIQGLCGPYWDTESATQVAAIEVMAAMANSGDRLATRALVEELTRLAMDYAWSETYTVKLRGEPVQHIDRILPALPTLQGSITWERDPALVAQLDAVRRELRPGVQAQSRLDKSMRFWEQRQAQLFSIVVRYGRVPLSYITDGLRTEPPYVFSQSFPKGKVQLDDLAYFLAHAEALVDASLEEAR